MNSRTCAKLTPLQLIKVQHENEENWFKGRQGLIEKQKARKEGQKKLDEVL